MDGSTYDARWVFLHTPTLDPAWLLVEEGFNLAREHEIESLFSVANGYIGARGSLAEGSTLSSPATFIAGIYDHDPRASVPELAVAPDWMQLRAAIDGQEIRLEGSKTLAHRRVLDLRLGILWRDWRFEDPAGRITHVGGLRLASLADRHLLIQSAWFIPENYSGRLTLSAKVEPAPDRPGRNELIAIRTRVIDARGRQGKALELQTRDGRRIAFAAASAICVFTDTGLPSSVHAVPQGADHWDVDVQLGKIYRLDRAIVVFTSRDLADPADAAARHLSRLLKQNTHAHLDAHIAAWQRRWQTSDIVIDGDADAQRALRFAIYHLISAANPDDPCVSVGARALTGPGYKGHVFWDTEIFMLPFYIYTCPATARALLYYRFHTLPAARAKAARLGYSGALYAWESTDNGEETTPDFSVGPSGEIVPVYSGEQEHHISADIAYGVWHYFQATGDDAFMLEAGAEILIETARFWASRVRYGDDHRYHIDHVIGPDEYHDDVNDNVYTNLMAQCNVEYALDIVTMIEHRWPVHWQTLQERLVVTQEERHRWHDVAAHMYRPSDDQTHVIEQFKGYFALEFIDVHPFERYQTPLDILLGQERTRRSQIIKQADVLMLIFLLWNRFDDAMRRTNYRYYEARTGHGSSLSPAIHALLAARLGEHNDASRYFQQAAEIDLADNMGNAAAGVHAAALGGLWQATIMGYAGMHAHPEGLSFDPHLPAHWRGIKFSLQWRGRQLHVTLRTTVVSIDVEGCEGVVVSVGNTTSVTVTPGRCARWELSAHQAWREVAT